MSVNYTQYCIYGIHLEEKNYRTVISPAEYEMQNRYDTKTGKIIRQEKVLVKNNVIKYEVFGVEEYGWWELCDGLEEQFPCLDVVQDEDSIFIGQGIGDSHGDRIELIEGDVTLEELKAYHEEVKEQLNVRDEELSLHFFTRIE